MQCARTSPTFAIYLEFIFKRGKRSIAIRPRDLADYRTNCAKVGYLTAPISCAAALVVFGWLASR